MSAGPDAGDGGSWAAGEERSGREQEREQAGLGRARNWAAGKKERREWAGWRWTGPADWAECWEKEGSGLGWIWFSFPFFFKLTQTNLNSNQV